MCLKSFRESSFKVDLAMSRIPQHSRKGWRNGKSMSWLKEATLLEAAQQSKWQHNQLHMEDLSYCGPLVFSP
jgi:hypothetical protein